MNLGFVVDGLPIGQGRISCYGKGRAVHSNDKQLQPWRKNVRAEALAAAEVEGWEMTELPVVLHARFYFPRPAIHYGSGRNSRTLRPGAPYFFTKTPDLDHLIRAIGDALAGAVINDDKQIVQVRAGKSYAGPDSAMQTPGVVIEVMEAKR